MRHVPRWRSALRDGVALGGNAVSAYPTLRQILLLGFVAFPLSQFLLFPALGQDHPLAGVVVGELFLLFIAWLAIRRQRWVAEDLFLLNAVPSPALPAAAMAACGVAILTAEFDRGVLSLLARFSFEPPVALQQFRLDIQLIPDVGQGLVVLLVVVLLPALCEEAFFRGFVLTGLRYHFGPRRAVMGSALLFAFAHFDPWSFPAYLVLGFFLGYVVHRTHSLWPAVLAHGINNGLSVLLVNVHSSHGGMPDVPMPLPLLIVAGVCAFVGCRRLGRVRPLMPILSPFAPPPQNAGRP